MKPASWRSGFALVVGITGLVLVGAVAAVAARSAANPFELTFEGTHEVVPDSPTYPFGLRHVGTFTSTAPFCESGSAVDLQVVQAAGTPVRAIREFTCAHGEGSLTLAVEHPILEHAAPFTTTWRVVGAAGSYAGLRGTGTLRGALLGGDNADPPSVRFRATSLGFVDDDAVAPTIGFTSATMVKLRRPLGAHSLRLALTIRDDVEGNPVGFEVVVRSQGAQLGRKVGSTASGSVSLRVRVRIPAATRAVQVEATAVDPVGNQSSAARMLKLPRSGFGRAGPHS
jgi:hypothetical protein